MWGISASPEGTPPCRSSRSFPRKEVPVSRIIRFALAAFIVANAGVTTVLAQPQGILETATGNGLRPRLSSGQIQNFLPSRGRFTFPEPYRTTGVRLTNSSDCGGSDCVHY